MAIFAWSVNRAPAQSDSETGFCGIVKGSILLSDEVKKVAVSVREDIQDVAEETKAAHTTSIPPVQ